MKTRTWIAGLASATLVATVGFVAAGSTGNAVSTGTAGDPVQLGSGTLTWKTVPGTGKTATTTITYDAAPTGTTPQSLTENKCVYVAGVGTQYLLFEPVAGPSPLAIGFTTGSLGVKSSNETNNTGLACRQVNSKIGEVLRVRLNPAATSGGAGTLGRPYASSAVFDMNLAGNATIEATMYRGDTLVGQALMVSGTSTIPSGYEPKAQTFDCNKDQNSGAQSRSANNCYWPIRAITTDPRGGFVGSTSPTKPTDLLWDSIVFTVTKGDASIQGSQSWPAGSPESAGTQINLTTFSDGQIACYDPADPSTLNAAQAAAFGDSRAVITRLKLGDPTKECVLKPYTYTDTDNTSVFRYPSVSGQESSQFVLRLPRDFTKTQAAGIPQLPDTIVNWEDKSADVTVRTCIPGLITDIGDSEFKVPTVDYSKITGAVDSTGKSTIDQTTLTNGIQYACIYAQQMEVTGTGDVVAYDYIYFHGDILLRTK